MESICPPSQVQVSVMNVICRRSRRSKGQVAEVLQEFHSSDLTQTAFAKQYGLNQSASLLLKKARPQPSQASKANPAFVENDLPKPSVSFDYKVTFWGGLALEVRGGFAPCEPASLIEVLRFPVSPGLQFGCAVVAAGPAARVS
jgi:hypothetical protein